MLCLFCERYWLYCHLIFAAQARTPAWGTLCLYAFSEKNWSDIKVMLHTHTHTNSVHTTHTNSVHTTPTLSTVTKFSSHQSATSTTGDLHRLTTATNLASYRTGTMPSCRKLSKQRMSPWRMTNKSRRKVIVEGTRARERHVCSPLGCLEVRSVGTSQPPQVAAQQTSEKEEELTVLVL